MSEGAAVYRVARALDATLVGKLMVWTEPPVPALAGVDLRGDSAGQPPKSKEPGPSHQPVQ